MRISYINYGLILNFVGVAVAVVSLYYASKKPSRSDKPQVVAKLVKEEKPPVKLQKVLDRWNITVYLKA